MKLVEIAESTLAPLRLVLDGLRIESIAEGGRIEHVARRDHQPDVSKGSHVVVDVVPDRTSGNR
jgi:hypothetical protein